MTEYQDIVDRRIYDALRYVAQEAYAVKMTDGRDLAGLRKALERLTITYKNCSTPTNGDIMIKYSVTLKTSTTLVSPTSITYQTDVEIEDRGGAVENNGAAIQAAIALATKAGHVVSEPLRVVRI